MIFAFIPGRGGLISRGVSSMFWLRQLKDQTFALRLRRYRRTRQVMAREGRTGGLPPAVGDLVSRPKQRKHFALRLGHARAPRVTLAAGHELGDGFRVDGMYRFYAVVGAELDQRLSHCGDRVWLLLCRHRIHRINPLLGCPLHVPNDTIWNLMISQYGGNEW